MALKVAQEELEVDKYLDEQLNAKQTGEYDKLFYDVKEQQSEPEKPADEETSTDDITDEGEDASTDGEQTPDEETSVATESMRSDQIDLITEETLSQESWEAVGYYGGKLLGILKTFSMIGLHYGAIAIRKVFKGILYALGNLVSGLLRSIVTLNEQRIRITQSFENSLENIQTLKKALDAIDNAKELDDQVYGQVKIINSLKIADSVDFTHNLEVLNGFLSKSFSSLGTSVNQDLTAIKQLIVYVTSNTVKSPDDLLNVSPLTSHLQSGSVDGFQEHSDLLESYVLPEELPGDVELIGYLPKSSLDNIDEISKAYNESTLFLGFNKNKYHSVDTVPYLTKDELVKFIDSLETVCKTAIQHVEFYQKLDRDKKALRYNFRLYISAIVGSSRKISIADSLVNHVSLKAMFIDRVYMPAAIDIHDYTIRVVIAGLQFAKANISKLS